MLSRRAVLSSALAAATVPLAVSAGGRWTDVFAPEGVALGGTDPVGYFVHGRPVPGGRELSVVWRGATWHFAAPATRAAFEMNPRIFAPRFGGHCVWAMSEGRLEATVPDAWLILGDRLYLAQSQDNLARFAADPRPVLIRAQANWKALHG